MVTLFIMHKKAPSPEEKEVTKVTNKSTTKNVQGNGKTLVVYYSAQNHTKDVAQKVAENLGQIFLKSNLKKNIVKMI